MLIEKICRKNICKEERALAKTVVGIFENRDDAERAARQVKEQGLRTEDISIVAKQDNNNTSAVGIGGNMEERRITATMEVNKPINDNISDGVIAGGVLGGLAGLLIGAGSMMIPGLGIVAAAGPITGLLSGAVTGGIVGGLVDLGIPEKNGRQYESDIRSGRVLFSMRTDDDKVERLKNILIECGAKKVDAY
jgi:hypothetical protein